MNIIEIVNDFTENLIEFSESIKDLRESKLSDEQITEYLSEIRTEVLKDAKSQITPVIEVLEGTSKLSEVKQEQIRLLIENSNKEQRTPEEIEEGLDTLLRLAKAADRDLNLNFFESMFKEMVELLLSLMIKVKPEQAAELQKILNKLKG